MKSWQYTVANNWQKYGGSIQKAPTVVWGEKLSTIQRDFKRLGCRESSLSRLEIARLGRISPLSYFWKAFFPPPRMVPA